MKLKKIIVLVVALAALAIVAKPYVPALNSGQGEFTVTPNPYNAYHQALGRGEPVFLEFYADR